jgi:hypothetical protein
MNRELIDNSILLIAAIVAIIIIKCSRQRTTGAWSSFFLLFPALIIFLNMWAHTVAVIIVNIQRCLAGKFQYSFTFYGLVFFGVVFILVSGYNIHLSRKRITGDASVNKRIHVTNIITSIGFLPMVLLNPIASLPVLASIVSSISLAFLKISAKSKLNAKVHTALEI